MEVLPRILDKVEALEAQVHKLTLLMMKDKVDTTWIPEDQAAEMLGYVPRTLRRRVVVKGGCAPYPFNLISYRHTNGRSYQYNRKDLLKFKQLTSTSPNA